MAEDGQEKSQQPTWERLREAREEGRHPFSRETVTAVSFLGIVLWLSFAQIGLRLNLQSCLADFFSFTRWDCIDASSLGRLMLKALGYFATAAGPLMAVALVLGVASNIAQVGFQIAAKKSLFDLSRINPAGGMSKIFTMGKVFDGVKSLAKALLFAAICGMTIRAEFEKILILSSMPTSMALETTIALALKIVWRAALLMIVLAAIDLFFQRWQHRKQLMMTHQEIKEEHKKMEGDPTNKRRQRTRQLEFSRNRMITAIRTADVVLTNPTHYAVALEYKPELSSAPRVVAKGQLLMAQRLKDEARKHKVPVIEDRFLARTLFKSVKVGQEIPYTLYKAVAEILAYVYRLAGKAPKRRPAAARPALPGRRGRLLTKRA